MTNAIANIGIRAAQLIFAAIVCGLSIDLAKGHKNGGLPVTLGYVSFVGCVSLLAGFVGLASTWVEKLQGKIGLIVDGFIMVANLAGGLLVAVKLGGIKCDKNDDSAFDMCRNDLMNGGPWDGEYYPGYYCNTTGGGDQLVARCKKNQADSAFMFLTVIVLLVSLTLTYLRMKKGF
ncbi:hypothetical protein K458DRAFT_318698 [Lentithecium fluviatile CBS 122367]|uniref:MARVEL domain-containing protein n=1 Tax=Lentithecium fluviatile CBS 122367 TaxID=1168545 RepID=A0A6G1II53_9PLEO|nr:hypothetical protein K458DRAFT_318698 [Lentithecium fluviatile CBS 122367]